MTCPPRDKSLNRRDCLQVLGLGVLAGSTGCLHSRDSEPTSSTDPNSGHLSDDSSTSVSDTSSDNSDSGIDFVDECLSTSMQLQLSDYPELSMVGGSAVVSFPDDYVHILIVCIGMNDWIAVWKICTHGTCDVEWADYLGLVRCPCHNSLFDWDGTVLQGPATRPLASFDVCLDEDGRTLNIQRNQ